jgi:hypothetical protein
LTDCAPAEAVRGALALFPSRMSSIIHRGVKPLLTAASGEIDKETRSSKRWRRTDCLCIALLSMLPAGSAFRTLSLARCWGSVGSGRGIPGNPLACKCSPGDPCWPKPKHWTKLNNKAGGNLAIAVPPGAPCHSTFADQLGNLSTYNAARMRHCQRPADQREMAGRASHHHDVDSLANEMGTQNYLCWRGARPRTHAT